MSSLSPLDYKNDSRAYILPSKSIEWETPDEFFKNLNAVYHFTLDPCATHKNAKTPKYYTKEDDGLSKSWKGEIVFMNPPYGRSILEHWIKKAYDESRNDDCIVLALIPSYTSTSWFYNYVLPGATKIFFIKGRLTFKGAENSAGFGSLLVEFGENDDVQPIVTSMDTRGLIIW